jgi:hypothetical protein
MVKCCMAIVQYRNKKLDIGEFIHISSALHKIL